MRWDRFFEDLEDQLDSEWEAERAALDTEAERLRLSRLRLRERMAALRGGALALTLTDGTVLHGDVGGVGADWLALRVPDGAHLVPFAAVVSAVVSPDDLLRSARDPVPLGALAERMSFGYALRDLVRRRSTVIVRVPGAELSGTIDRAGADHFDIALHDVGEPRRRGAVAGLRIVSLDAVLSVRVLGEPPRS